MTVEVDEQTLAVLTKHVQHCNECSRCISCVEHGTGLAQCKEAEQIIERHLAKKFNAPGLMRIRAMLEADKKPKL